MSRRAAVLACWLTVLFLSSATHAASSCSDAVLVDWSDNGRIDRVYELACYGEAIDSLPQDLRDYTDAEAVIERALTSAVHKQDTSPPPASAAQQIGVGDGLPDHLLVLLALGLGMVSAGAAALILRARERR